MSCCARVLFFSLEISLPLLLPAHVWLLRWPSGLLPWRHCLNCVVLLGLVALSASLVGAVACSLCACFLVLSGDSSEHTRLWPGVALSMLGSAGAGLSTPGLFRKSLKCVRKICVSAFMHVKHACNLFCTRQHDSGQPEPQQV